MDYFAPQPLAERIQHFPGLLRLGFVCAMRYSCALSKLQWRRSHTARLHWSFSVHRREPNSAFLPPSVRRDESGRVLTDDSLRTTEPSIFAIGAVRAGDSGELVNAAGEAAAAVATIAGELAA